MSKDHWSIPGGAVDDNESPKQACAREIKDEVLWLKNKNPSVRASA